MALSNQLDRVQGILAEALEARLEVLEVVLALQKYQGGGDSGIFISPTEEATFADPVLDSRRLKARLESIARQHSANFPQEFKDLDSEALFNFGCLGMTDLFGSSDLLGKATKVSMALDARISTLRARIRDLSKGAAETTVIQKALAAFGSQASGRYTNSSMNESDAMADYQRAKKEDEVAKQRVLLDATNKTISAAAANVAAAPTPWQMTLGVALFPVRAVGVLIDNAKKGLLIAQYPATFRYCNEARNTSPNLANDFASAKAQSQSNAAFVQKTTAEGVKKTEEGLGMGTKYTTSDAYKVQVASMDGLLAAETALLSSKQLLQRTYDYDSGEYASAKNRILRSTSDFELESAIKWLETLRISMDGHVKKAQAQTATVAPPSTASLPPVAAPVAQPVFKPFIPPASDSGAGDSLPQIPVAPVTGASSPAASTVAPVSQSSAAVQVLAVRAPKPGAVLAESADESVAYTEASDALRAAGVKGQLATLYNKSTGMYRVVLSG